MPSEIFVKDIGKVLKPWYKQLKAYSNLPSGVCTYDRVKGFSAQKGNFEILSYKNKAGKLLQRITTYTDKNEVTTTNYTYDNFLTFINTKTTQAGTLTKNEYITLRKYDDGSFVELTEQLASSPSLDVQTARYLRPQHSPCVINVEDPWGNPKITSPGCSDGRMTFLEDRQFLPTVISNVSKERTNERIKSIEHVLANRNNISTSRTNTKRVSQDVLNPQAEFNEYIVRGDCNTLGEIRIWDELYATLDLYQTMGHEINHSTWFNYMDGILNHTIRGMGRKRAFTAKKLLAEEQRLQYIPYKEQSMEKLAFNEAPKIKQKFYDMFDNIVRFFET